MLLALCAHIVHAVIGAGASELADALINTGARQLVTISAVVLYVLSVRRGGPDRGSWLALAIGLGLWVAGNSYWDLVLVHQEDPPIPSPADAGRLAFYPFAYLCLGLHVRRTVRGVPASMWLDGLVGVLAVAALGVATVVAPIVAGIGGSTAELVVNAVYPICDVLLLALVIAFLGLAAGGRDRAWTLLGAGFALFAAAGTAYLYLLASGVAVSGPALKSVYLLGIATIALAPWQRPVTVRRRRRAGAALSERFSVEGIELQIAASIGVALFPEHGDDAETLLQRADVAMYQAKHRRSGTEFYARERDRHTRERLQLIGELRDAVARDHLTLHFQPKLDLGRNRINGVEALVRWPHPTRGVVPPDEFIPLAEQTGVIGPLTELVIRKALRQAADWAARGIALTMAVNVSATNLLEDGWTEGVLAALERHGVRPDRFVVEITEDVLMTDPDRSLTALAVLSAAGVRVALDDFGTGYSSLSYLKRLPVDELKIDRSFVFEMGTDPADAAIVQTAVDLGRRLGISVAAEGVEDADTLRRLTEYGAMTAQGFHIARPMPAHDLEEWLAAGGFVLHAAADHEDVERARPVDAFHAVQLDVGRRGRA
jgi:EAL domain-containing protein (putative c-di-GMP-specific phosphodiesterase class I)